jgi:hypothetical protein
MINNNTNKYAAYSIYSYMNNVKKIEFSAQDCKDLIKFLSDAGYCIKKKKPYIPIWEIIGKILKYALVGLFTLRNPAKLPFSKPGI